MIALTNKSSTRFKVKFAELTPVENGAWVVDLIKFGKGPLVALIVHQDSLFTLVRMAAELKTMGDVEHEIAQVWSPFESVAIVRNGNRRVTGSITDMKHMSRIHYAHGDSLRDIENRLNDCPFSYIGMEHPRRRFHHLMK